MASNGVDASDEEIKAHIEKQVATRVVNSPIYAFLFSDCLRITECSKGVVRARILLEHRHMNSGGGISPLGSESELHNADVNC